MRILVSELFVNGCIIIIFMCVKELCRYVEKLIIKVKNLIFVNCRICVSFLCLILVEEGKKDVFKYLFDIIVLLYVKCNGGYIRIYKLVNC